MKKESLQEISKWAINMTATLLHFRVCCFPKLLREGSNLFSITNKLVVICWLFTGFPPHVRRQTHRCIYSSGRYCDPPDIRGQIILLLHLASCETQDKLSWSVKAIRVSDRVQAECQQSAGRKVSVLLPPGLTVLWNPVEEHRCSVRGRAPFIRTTGAWNDT